MISVTIALICGFKCFDFNSFSDHKDAVKKNIYFLIGGQAKFAFCSAIFALRVFACPHLY